MTSRIAEAAVENEEAGAELVLLMLDERRDEFKINAAILKTAAQNTTCGASIMNILLRRNTILQTVLEAARNEESREDVTDLLLQKACE
jgi:hypothetical protein